MWKVKYTFEDFANTYDNENSSGVKLTAHVGYKIDALTASDQIDGST